MPAITNPLSGTSADAFCRCPLCGSVLPFRPHPPPYGAACQECGYPLWCCERAVGRAIVLDVVSVVAPPHEDVERLANTLVRFRDVPHVVVDLSDLGYVTSAFLAGLIVLYKRMRAAAGRLIVCGLQPAVRDIFHDSTLDRLFEMFDDEEAAVASL